MRNVEGKISHKFHIQRNLRFFFFFFFLVLEGSKHVEQKQTDVESRNHTITFPRASSNYLYNDRTIINVTTKMLM